MGFTTEITLTGPVRAPAQMLQDQVIEGPTHFSQFDPLAVAVWGDAWFERGCISSHFRTMVVEGEEVQASLTTAGPDSARIEAHKADGTPVLTGTASVGAGHRSELDARRAALGEPGELFIVDRLHVGMRSERSEEVSITAADDNGAAYPFSLAEKLERITEPHPWYTPEGGASSPWGRAIVPMEMITVLANKSGLGWPVRGPVMGLYLDLEVRLLEGPVFVGQRYRLDREIVGLSQSRRTESYWTKTTLTDIDTGRPASEVLIHSGVFKDSYPGYPKDRLR